MISKIIHADVIKGLMTIPRESVHLVICSPPYNIGINYPEHNDNMPMVEYYSWLSLVWHYVHRVLVPGGRLCINIGDNKRSDSTMPPHVQFTADCIKMGYLYRGTIIWSKESAKNHTAWGSWMSPSNPHIVPRHEYVLVFSKSQMKLEGEDADISRDDFIEATRSIWTFSPETRRGIGHPVPFPIELPRRLIQFYSFKGQTVMDPFAGSGSTGMAAAQTGRGFILIDNSLEYCGIAKKRIFDDYGYKIQPVIESL